MTRLQSKEEEKDIYDFDNENKESVKKKVEFLFRHIKKGLLRQRFAFVSLTFNTRSD